VTGRRKRTSCLKSRVLRSCKRNPKGEVHLDCKRICRLQNREKEAKGNERFPDKSAAQKKKNPDANRGEPYLGGGGGGRAPQLIEYNWGPSRGKDQAYPFPTAPHEKGRPDTNPLEPDKRPGGLSQKREARRARLEKRGRGSIGGERGKGERDENQ